MIRLNIISQDKDKSIPRFQLCNIKKNNILQCYKLLA